MPVHLVLLSLDLVLLHVHPCRYTGIHIGPPCLEEEYRQEEITPQQCRLRDITYAAPIYVDIEYTRGREIVTRKGPGQAVRIGRIPVMLQCNRLVMVVGVVGFLRVLLFIITWEHKIGGSFSVVIFSHGGKKLSNLSFAVTSGCLAQQCCCNGNPGASVS